MSAIRASLFSITLALLTSAQAFAQEATLEHYILGVGQNADGVSISLHDRAFGGGTTRGALHFGDIVSGGSSADTTGYLAMRVSRSVREDEITFALLCFKIEVRGYNDAGAVVFSKDLDGFTFGDSQSGRYVRTVRRIPLSVARLEVKFLGNYE